MSDNDEKRVKMKERQQVILQQINEQAQRFIVNHKEEYDKISIVIPDTKLGDLLKTREFKPRRTGLPRACRVIYSSTE